jgi:hypothetical protein
MDQHIINCYKTVNFSRPLNSVVTLCHVSDETHITYPFEVTVTACRGVPWSNK